MPTSVYSLWLLLLISIIAFTCVSSKHMPAWMFLKQPDLESEETFRIIQAKMNAKSLNAGQPSIFNQLRAKKQDRAYYTECNYSPLACLVKKVKMRKASW